MVAKNRHISGPKPFPKMRIGHVASYKFTKGLLTQKGPKKEKAFEGSRGPPGVPHTYPIFLFTASIKGLVCRLNNAVNSIEHLFRLS